MPTLKDTEWRILCVVVRQTLGWAEDGKKRKSRDWLSQRQLMARTGRNSAALSAAIDALVRRRLIDAWDEKGGLLTMPHSRRKYQGRIYYGLCLELLSHCKLETEKSALRKANRTKETVDKKEPIKEGYSGKSWGNGSGLLDSYAPHINVGWAKAGHIAKSKRLKQ